MVAIEERPKPTVKLIGEDGNVFFVIGRTAKTLRKARQFKESSEFIDRAFKAGSYDAVLNLVMEYCEVE